MGVSLPNSIGWTRPCPMRDHCQALLHRDPRTLRAPDPGVLRLRPGLLPPPGHPMLPGPVHARRLRHAAFRRWKPWPGWTCCLQLKGFGKNLVIFTWIYGHKLELLLFFFPVENEIIKFWPTSDLNLWPFAKLSSALSTELNGRVTLNDWTKRK